MNVYIIKYVNIIALMKASQINRLGIAPGVTDIIY